MLSMFGIVEILVILLLGIIIFGPKLLPRKVKKLGKMVYDINQEIKNIKSIFKK